MSGLAGLDGGDATLSQTAINNAIACPLLRGSIAQLGTLDIHAAMSQRNASRAQARGRRSTSARLPGDRGPKFGPNSDESED